MTKHSLKKLDFQYLQMIVKVADTTATNKSIQEAKDKIDDKYPRNSNGDRKNRKKTMLADWILRNQ